MNLENKDILILTRHSTQYRVLADITDVAKQEYAERHGYGFYSQEGDYCNMGEDFQRIPLIYDILFNNLLNREYKAVWFTGCDLTILNFTTTLQDFLKPADKHFFIHKDVNGLNNDSFVIDNSEWSRKWLQFIWDKEPEYRNDCWYSQRVMQHNAEKDEWKDGIAVLEHPGINSYFYDLYQWPSTTPGHFEKGHFCLHLPGMNLKERLEMFNSQRVKDLIIK